MEIEPQVLADGLVLCDQEDRAQLALADRFHQNPQIPVLIEGETGTGKELWARRIHHAGQSNDSPFVAINCAAISPGLFEAELFGYESGAFSGAAPEGRSGKMALAGEGTLFLDEISEMPADQQAKLLRALETRTYFKVGGRELQHFAARVICACNENLYGMVKAGGFRRDLYFRLKVAHLLLRPLRRRPEVIPVLVQEFVRRNYADGLASFDTVAPEAMELLGEATWPGNVRQLRHLLEEAGLVSSGTTLQAETVKDLLTGYLTTELHQRGSRRTSALVPNGRRVPLMIDWADLRAEHLPDDQFPLRQWERALLIAALEKHRGSPVKTAAYLGISRKVLYTLRKNHGLLDQGS